MEGQQPCYECGAPVSGRYREVVAIEEVRTPQGGAHSMIARRPTGRQICDSCVSDIRNGRQPNAPRLFV